MKKKKDPSLQELLEDAFKINFTCLRIANQETPFAENKQFFSRDDIFNKKKGMREFWLQGKIEGAAETRRKFFDIINESVKSVHEEYDYAQIDREIQDGLMEQFNKYYKTDKKFEECFRGYEILDPDFKEVFEMFDNHAIISETRLGMNFLINAYYAYLNHLADKSTVLAYEAIFKTLEDDIMPNGYRSFYYKKPQDARVSILTREQVDNLILTLYPVITNVEAEKASLEKVLKDLYKRQRKNPIDKQINQEIMQNSLRSKTLYIKMNKLQAAAKMVTTLDSRLSSASTDYDKSLATDLTEKIFDGLTNAGGEDFKIDTAYIHDLEKSQLAFLFKNVGLENPFKKTAKSAEKSQ